MPDWYIDKGQIIAGKLVIEHLPGAGFAYLDEGIAFNDRNSFQFAQMKETAGSGAGDERREHNPSAAINLFDDFPHRGQAGIALFNTDREEFIMNEKRLKCFE